MSNINPFVGFVQFTHPGKEHSITKTELKNNFKSWNYSNHKRKFIRADGQYINSSGQICNGNLLFWGEWEPESKIQSLPNLPNPKSGDYPHYIHTPLLTYGTPDYNSKGKVRQNTDPCVFGDCFHYSCCKQGSFKSLSKLLPGSIILFGSTLDQNTKYSRFAVDTVFVVGSGMNYLSNNYLPLIQNKYITSDYSEIMGFKIWQNYQTSVEYKCYSGATPQSPVDQMYSFVPCKICTNNQPFGFERFVLRESDLQGLSMYYRSNSGSIFNDNLNAAPKVSILINGNSNFYIWDKIRQLLHSKGFEEGVRFNL